MGRFKQAWELLRATRGGSVSMRRKLIVYWASMLLVLFAGALVLASAFGVFSMSENNLRHMMETHHTSTALSVEKQMNLLAARVIAVSQDVGGVLDNHLLTYPTSKLDDDAEELLAVERALASTAAAALESSPCNGVFILIDATINTQAGRARHSRAGVYLRYANLSVNGAVDQDIVLFRGISNIARENNLELHNRWRLEFDTSLIPRYEQLMGLTDGRVLDNCSLSRRVELTDTWESALLMSAPIYGSDGRVRGACGVELSDLFVRLCYPSQQSEYGTMVTLIAPMKDGALSVGQGMTGDLGATYLSDADTLYVHERAGLDVYTGASGSFLGIGTPLSTPFDGEGALHVVTLVPQAYFSSVVLADRLKIVAGSSLLLVAAVLLSRFLSKRFVRPISEAVAAISANGAVEDHLTGFSEIDALVSVLDSKAANLKPSLLPPDVASMLDDFSQRYATLTATERAIVALYAEGLETSDVAERLFISIHTARKHNVNIYRKLNVGARDELVLYLELFRRCGKLFELLGPPEN